jgi:hypothetical protein
MPFWQGRQNSRASSRRMAAKFFRANVGDENNDAVVKLSPTQINRGAPVRIDSFRLAMP